MVKVLYVEDSPAQRDILARMLKINGFEVVVASDGLEGIEKARTWLPDIILMSLKLPRMDGFEAIINLRSEEKTAHIPIIATSAWASVQHKKRALVAGANQVLTKPVDLNKLLPTINRYVKDSTAATSTKKPGKHRQKKLSAAEVEATQTKKETTTKKLQRDTDKAQTFFNPYIAGPPITDPAMFFGRQSDLEKIISLLASNFIMVIGARRIGKTSLLYQLAYYLADSKNTPEQFVPVLINVEGIPEAEFFHAVMEEIANTVQKHLLAEVVTNLSFDLSNPIYTARPFSRDLQTILKGLQATTPKPSRLVLLLDEMDTLNNYSLETQSQLRRIFQRFTNRNLSVVVAGVKLQRHWAGESSPFYNMFIPVSLPPLSKKEARRLIIKPVKDAYNYSDKAVARILEATLGLPHRIQQLCLEATYRMVVTSGRRTEITVEDVNAILETIHWLGEEITEENEEIILPIVNQSPAIVEARANYQATQLAPDDDDEKEKEEQI